MSIHLYAQTWNDARMLPSFFGHYDSIVDEYFIFDDGSSDATLDVLAAHPRVHVGEFPRSVSGSFVLSEQAHSNEAWKASRGIADWVIVTDVDEHLWHPDLNLHLDECNNTGVTLIPALGFQMISDTPPAHGLDLCRTHRYGAPWTMMMKPSIFDPDAIDEINFDPGRHAARPEGEVIAPETDEVLLFHYKYLGFDATLQRHRELLGGLGPIDHMRQYGHKYSWLEEQLRTDWERFRVRSLDTRKIEHAPAAVYPHPRWWSPHRRSIDALSQASAA